MPVRFLKGPSLTLEEALKLLGDLFGMTSLCGSAAGPTSLHGVLADDGQLDDDDDWDFRRYAFVCRLENTLCVKG